MVEVEWAIGVARSYSMYVMWDVSAWLLIRAVVMLNLRHEIQCLWLMYRCYVEEGNILCEVCWRGTMPVVPSKHVK